MAAFGNFLSGLRGIGSSIANSAPGALSKIGTAASRAGSALSGAAGRAGNAFAGAARSAAAPGGIGSSFLGGLRSLGSAAAKAAPGLLRTGAGIAAAAAPGLLQTFAPMAGQVLGNLGQRIGGERGAALGSGLGNMVNNMFGAPQQQAGAPDEMAQQQNPGEMLTGAMNSYVPEQYQNMSLDQAGQGLQDYGANAINSFLGPNAGQAGFGQALTGMASNFLGNQFGRYLPQGFGQMTPAMFSQQAGNYLNSFMPQGFGGFDQSQFQQPEQAYADGGMVEETPMNPMMMGRGGYAGRSNMAMRLPPLRSIVEALPPASLSMMPMQNRV